MAPINFVSASIFTAGFDSGKNLLNRGRLSLVRAGSDWRSLNELEVVDGYLRELLTSGPTAVAAAKQLIASVAGRPVADVTDLTAQTIARQRVSPEGQDGMRAFLEKRKLSWHS